MKLNISNDAGFIISLDVDTNVASFRQNVFEFIAKLESVQTFNVFLKTGRTDTTKWIEILKVVRSLNDCGLKEGKDLVEAAGPLSPRLVNEKITLNQGQANEWVKALNAVGADAVIRKAQ